MTIRKVGRSYVLYSGKGKKLFSSPSRAATIHRERQVVFFKNNAKYKKDHGHGIPLKRKR